ncbi:hypothetical protein K8I61_14415 [bacterium]|nr:hypothetical protein [bacterium]
MRTPTMFFAAVMVLVAAAGAFADENFDAELYFDSPSAIVPDTEYLFEFSVENYSPVPTTAGVANNWISDVEIFMPSADYMPNVVSLDSPDALHPADGEWQVSYGMDVDGTYYIRWMFVAHGSAAVIGDIHEGELLGFEFTATTDSAATDGFDYTLINDVGDSIDGTAYIGGADDDADDDDMDDDADDDDASDDDDAFDDDDASDDDDADDAADDDGGDDDDDDDDGGCGCGC